MLDVLAFDRIGTVRTMDEDGRLRVSKTPISKANVCPYYGREIPGNADLGLDPDKKYMLLRDPEELKSAAKTFNNLPVLEKHFHVTADNPRRDLQIGATGEGASFEDPFLYNSLIVWDGEAISRIKSGEQRELSSAYRYTPDMTPGEFKGEKYDGVMRDIRGSHVAIVADGRAGPDVLVADSNPMENKTMANKKKVNSLIEKIRPFLASDADIDECKKAMDEDENLEISREDRLKDAGFSDDEIAKMCASLDVTVDDDDADDNDEDDDDAAEDESDEEAREDESDGEEARLERERKDREDERRGVKAAMDSAVKEVERRVRELHEAREAVKPVAGIVAMDSAEAVYGFALKQSGYNLAGIPKSAYKAMFGQHQTMVKRNEKAKSPRIATDSKAAETLFEQFPALNRIKGA